MRPASWQAGDRDESFQTNNSADRFTSVKANVIECYSRLLPVRSILRLIVSEGECELPGRKLLAHILGKVKAEGIGVRTHALVDKSDLVVHVIAEEDRDHLDDLAA